MSDQALDTSSVLNEMLVATRAQAKVLWAIAVPFAMLISLSTGLVFPQLSLSPLAFAIELTVGFLYQGVVSELLQSKPSLKPNRSILEMLEAAVPVMPMIAGAGAFAGLLIGIGFLIVLIPGLLLITIWSVIVPVLIYEEEKVFSSLERSRELVHGNGWTVLPVVFGAFLFGVVLDLAMNGAADQIGSNLWLRMTSTAIAWLAALPIVAVAAHIIYFRLRERPEI